MVTTTVGRKRLGIELRKLRERKELTNLQAAQHIGVSEATLSRIETGKRFAKPAELRALMELYGVSDTQQQERFQAMSKIAVEESWWDEYDDVLPSGLDSYMGFESEAVALRSYDDQLLHGLLQTEDYARTVIHASRPRAPKEVVARLTELRMQRKHVLEREPALKLWNIIDESVLRRPVGGPAVMAAQLRHLAALAELPNLTVQVLPFARGAHVAMSGPFMLLEFDDPQDCNQLYLDAPTGNIFIQKREVVTEFRERFDLLNAAAMAPEESLSLIIAIAEDYAR
ncbi:helix-turn-helix domain-containing protein [Salinactinospora qingdaonensis]|uniref:Helix-turn-helix transcriptional regulator n=1 Tax=Salinactinospora qingdaonensis TaxID=702744 RepID=A0ABP7FES7_9ACTN